MRTLSGLISFLCVATSLAQSKPATPRPEDVKSLDSIVAAVYDSISGPPGQKRDWDRFRALFITGARLIAVGRRKSGEIVQQTLTVEDYITGASPYLEGQGFFEREIARRTEGYGNIAQIFSTYESRNKLGDAKPFERGINGMQLLDDGKRWWVVTIYWRGEDSQTKLPEKYLKKGK